MANLALNHKDWIQAGMDPERHTHFYDRATQRPIKEAAESLQIGPMVFVKHPVYHTDEEMQQFPYAKGGSVYPIKDTDKLLKHVSPTSYLSKVSALPMNAHDRKKIEQLKREMHAGKKLEPLVIMANGAADGRHRAHAAKELGIKKVPVVDDEHVLAKGGAIKPVGYTKEKVTVSPNLDQMRYELMSVKHYAKKVK